MTLHDRIRELPIRRTALQTAVKPYAWLHSTRHPRQKHLLDDLRDRDEYAIVVFDALRYDYAREILPMYLRGDIQPVWSAAHDTFQYGNKCWGDRVYDTTYVSGAVPLNSTRHGFEEDWFNQLYGGFVPDKCLPNLVDAWEDAWDTGLGTVDPDRLTELAQQYVDRDQLAVHYFQPHAPYIGQHGLLGHTDTRDAEPLTGDPIDEPIWEAIKTGAIAAADHQAAYRANVHRAVQAALPLLEALCQHDREVIVMADHGELLAGDYPHRELVAHPRVSLPEIRRVPWMQVDGVRHHPTTRGHESDASSIPEKLTALGYRE